MNKLWIENIDELLVPDAEMIIVRTNGKKVEYKEEGYVVTAYYYEDKIYIDRIEINHG